MASCEFEPQAALAGLIARTRFEALPDTAVAKAKVFVIDALGVGLAGTSWAVASDLAATVAGWGEGRQARSLLDGRHLPAGNAALLNATFMHGLEFDPVHEAAVVHAMTPVLAATLAFAEWRRANAGTIDGRSLITALAVGVDVAASLGMAARGPMGFFRPATAGAFGATAALANLAGFDESTASSALGLVFGQISGTLQPHSESSSLLPLQMGFNARAALHAFDLAAAGISGPRHAISGPYGYLQLFEGGCFDLAPIRHVTDGGAEKPWRIAELSHKPWPSGRLTHGAIDGLARLQAAHGFEAEAVVQVEVVVPPLVARLTGRPDVAAPDEAYARLCLPFVAAVQLLRGRVEVSDFRGDALADPQIHELASRIQAIADPSLDPNAMAPQTVRVRLRGGRSHEVTLTHVLGHPDRPLDRAAQLDKLRRCCAIAARPLDAERIDTLIATVDALENLADAADLMDLVTDP